LASVTFSKKELGALVGRKLVSGCIEKNLPSLGMPIENIEGEEICVDITPNRPDLLSIEGIARALSAFIGGKTREYDAEESGVELHVDSSVLSVRPFIVGAVVREVKIDDEAVESLMQLQEKLHETYGRKRRKVSIGVHNFDAVQPPFVYKAVEPRSYSFVPLDMRDKLNLSQILEKHPKGREYGSIISRFSRYPLLVDSKEQALSFPPVINGELTRVNKNTRNLFIDVTGTDENAVMDALKIVALSLVDRGGKLYTVEVAGKRKFKTPDLRERIVELPAEKINKMLGTNFTQAQLSKLLERMGYARTGGRLKVPCYRVDIMDWVDLAEDVAIAYGYNSLTPSLPNFFSIGKEKHSEIVEGRLKEVLVGLGFNQAVCQNLTSERDCFEKALLPEKPFVKIKNPNVEECTMMRCWLLPSLLNVLFQSRQAELPIKIFEVGDVLSLDGTHVTESRSLACALYDSKATFNEIKSMAEAVAREMGWKVGVRVAEHSSFIKGRAAELFCGKKKVGVLGEIHPQVINNFGLEQPLALLEMDITSFF